MRLVLCVLLDNKIDPSVLLISLHWLPIKQRIKFKILLTVYKCLNGRGPAYLSELLSPYTNSKFATPFFDHLNLVTWMFHGQLLSLVTAVSVYVVQNYGTLCPLELETVRLFPHLENL